MQQPLSDITLQRARAWESLTKKAFGVLSFDQFRKIYQILFEGEVLPIAWLPHPDAMPEPNLSKLMKKMSFSDYASCYQWSIAHRKQFWKNVLEVLDIKLDKPFDKVLNLDQGAEHPHWLLGAQMNIVRSCFKAKPDKVALIISDENNNIRKYTYQQLDSLSKRVASGLLNMGLVPQDRVVLYLPLGVEAVAAYLGIIRAGMVAVLVADSFSPQELKKRIQLSQAKAVLTVEEYQYGGKSLHIYDKVKKAEAPLTVVIASSGDTDLRENDLLWDEFLEDEYADFYSSPPDQMISILFSSGTTKDPKAIPWTQLTPIKCAADAYFHQDVHAEDILTWTTGMGWMMGPWSIFGAMINQATLALFTGSAASKAFGQFVANSGVTILGTIPSLVKSWRNSGVMEGFQWKVRVFSSTGEPSQAEDYLYLMWLARFRAPVIEYCGGTEIGGGYITGSVVQPASPGTFTTPTLGLQLVFQDEKSGQIGSDQEGEVFIVPPSIGLSQHILNRDHHEEYFEGTPFWKEGLPLRKHGDVYRKVAVVAGTTFYKSMGRSDDSMNLGGIKVSALEIEEILNEHPSIFETAAVAVPPAEGGPEELFIFYVPSVAVPDENILKKQLQERLSETLNPLFRIKKIVAREHLPRTASNKLMRRSLRKDFEEIEGK